ncbi:cupredoxin domain-containing protein [Pseudarthrobacter sp. N5]|uniref:cupredoxin domain-containing protein n=1 Tax=Pseudarthrobacter sp. N5 TaxID=3418416 RepID=UPI003CEE2628
MNHSRANRHRLAAAILAGAAILGITACGNSGGSYSSSPPASSASGTQAATTIQIKSFAYSGADTVPAGATVTVTNMDAQAHTVTADDGSFDAVVKGGESVTFKAPAKAGTYTYHCTYHSKMKGTLTVK